MYYVYCFPYLISRMYYVNFFISDLIFTEYVYFFHI